ncbi:MAG: AAA family ATPase [Phycisphaerae bacterium]|nr:AAA family ATPase [Saprospiraceae bacterium]
MKIKKLEINNFRGFRQATVEFPESNLAVFIGVNGQGKSSLLDAVSIVLHGVSNSRALSGSLDDPRLKNDDIRIGEIEASVKSDLILYGELHNFSQKLRQHEIPHTYSKPQNGLIQPIFVEKNLPLIAYYRTNREINLANAPETPPSMGREAGYFNAINATLNSFSDFVEWFKIEDDVESREIKKLQDFKYQNPRLTPVRRCLSEFLSKLNIQFQGLRVVQESAVQIDYANPIKKFDLYINKEGQELKLSQLSHGERALILLVADIARRAAILNSDLDNPLLSEGIVLIDEIELHLHPKWQREVIPALLATFPNIQFLLSTHSPQVLSRVDSEDIFLLKDGEVLKLSSNPKGMDTNAILEEVMDTPKYPREVDVLVDELFALIQQRKFDEAEEARRKVAEASPDNPVLQRADAMMERLKILN